MVVSNLEPLGITVHCLLCEEVRITRRSGARALRSLLEVYIFVTTLLRATEYVLLRREVASGSELCCLPAAHSEDCSSVSGTLLFLNFLFACGSVSLFILRTVCPTIRM